MVDAVVGERLIGAGAIDATFAFRALVHLRSALALTDDLEARAVCPAGVIKGLGASIGMGCAYGPELPGAGTLCWIVRLIIGRGAAADLATVSVRGKPVFAGQLTADRPTDWIVHGLANSGAFRCIGLGVTPVPWLVYALMTSGAFPSCGTTALTGDVR